MLPSSFGRRTEDILYVQYMEENRNETCKTTKGQREVIVSGNMLVRCVYFRRIKVNFIKDCGLKLKNVAARTGERRKRHKSPAAN